MTKQYRFTPNAIQTDGDPKTGDIFLHFKDPNESVATIQLTPELIEIFLRNLAQCIAISPNQKTKEKVQLFAIRNITAQSVHSSLVTLRYETEVGITLETTIEPSEASVLSEQLQNALSGIGVEKLPKQH